MISEVGEHVYRFLLWEVGVCWVCDSGAFLGMMRAVLLREVRHHSSQDWVFIHRRAFSVLLTRLRYQGVAWDGFLLVLDIGRYTFYSRLRMAVMGCALRSNPPPYLTPCGVLFILFVQYSYHNTHVTRSLHLVTMTSHNGSARCARHARQGSAQNAAGQG